MGFSRQEHWSGVPSPSPAIYLYKKLNHVLLQLLMFNTPGKELRVESRNEVLYAQGETGRTGLQRLFFFPGANFMSSILCVLVSRKTLKSFSVLTAPCDQQKTSAKNYVLDCMYSPFTKITHILTFSPASLEQFLRAISDAVSWAAVLILPPVKLNLQLSHCVFFLLILA